MIVDFRLSLLELIVGILGLAIAGLLAWFVFVSYQPGTVVDVLIHCPNATEYRTSDGDTFYQQLCPSVTVHDRG